MKSETYREHLDCVRSAIERTIANRDTAIKALSRADATLRKLRHREQRLQRSLKAKEASDLAIPGFLQRTKPSKDAEVAAAIKQEQEDHKKAKARGRIAKLKAQKAGDTKRMPLSGREAAKFLKEQA